jgi:GTP cyclohydrolase IA
MIDKATKEQARENLESLPNTEELYKNLLKSIGEDIHREGLVRTPQRAARALTYLTQGYQTDIDKVVNRAIFESDNDEMIIVKDIEVYSLCEHHLLPFFGKCHVGYIPSGKIIGLSKVARIVDVFARRLQVQENLTKQIAETLLKHTQAQGVAVVMEAQHLCMMMRGVEKQNSLMKTSCMLGAFRKDQSTRSEFLNLIKT